MDRETGRRADTGKPSACSVDGKHLLCTDLFFVLSGEKETETERWTDRKPWVRWRQKETDGWTDIKLYFVCSMDGKHHLHTDLFLVLPGEMETETDTDGRTENLVLPGEMETETETDGRTAY